MSALLQHPSCLLRACKQAAIISAAASSKRSISTSQALAGRRNFRKFPITNKRGIFEHPKLPKELMENEYRDRVVTVDDVRIRWPGVWFGRRFVHVPEMEPELVVPEDFESSPLKPYVSNRAEEISQSEFTAEQLFAVTYGREIARKVKAGEVVDDQYLVMDEEAAREAKNRALKTGADVFSHTSYFGSLDKDWRYGH